MPEINRARLLAQLKDDEGFRAKAYPDKKQWSYGYGCRAPGKDATITEPAAAELVKQHMKDAIGHFNRIFAGHLDKFNDVRAEAFINMIFNMGPGRKGDPGAGGMLSFVNTLNLIYKNKYPPWLQVAANLKRSLWFQQVDDSGDSDGPGPDQGRGERIVEEVATGVKKGVIT